jgi:hypothetical protein
MKEHGEESLSQKGRRARIEERSFAALRMTIQSKSTGKIACDTITVRTLGARRMPV